MNQEIIKTSSELYEEATEAAMLLNEAILVDSHSAIKKQRKAATEAVDAANKAYRDEAYAVLLANENPFLAAITTGYRKYIEIYMEV